MSGLWVEACRLYEAAGVRELCLELQDEHGVDVVVLLAVVWAWRRAVVVEGARLDELRARTSAWRAAVVGPLRDARRALRADAVAGRYLGVPAGRQADLKSQVQAAELAAERCQLEALERLLRGWPTAPTRPPLSTVLAPLAPRIGDPDGWRPLLAAVAASGDGP